MKTSQKGTKLNEVRYFRQSRPYTKKRITKMRVIPDLPELHGNVISSAKDQIPTSIRSSARSRDRCVTVDRDQRSREIAWIIYSDSEEFLPERKNSRSRRDTLAETETEREMLVCFPEPEEPEVIGVCGKSEAEKEVQAELEPRVEEKNVGVDESVEESVKESMEESVEPSIPAKPENLTVIFPVKPEVREKFHRDVEPEVVPEVRRQDSPPQVRSDKNSSDSERSFWLRYSGIRKLLDFFGHLLGKRATGSADEDARTTEDRRSAEKNYFSNETRSKPPISASKSRAKKSRGKNASEKNNRTTRQPEVPGFSGLARQIMNTRDKRLRIALMEHELRARKLEEENRRYRRILEEKLRNRQMSSPLN